MPLRALSLALAACAAVAQAQGPDTARTPRATTRDSSVRLAPIEVRASIAPTAGPAIGSAVPARISVLSGGDIDAWEPRTLADAIGAQPGVSIYDDLGSPYKLNMSTRGFTVGPTVGLPPGVSVFLDGVRQNEPDAQEVNFDLLPLEHVERVEVLSGTASLLGPNSLGGAVNLITRRGSGPLVGEVELSGGSFGNASGEASLGGARSGWDYHASGGYERENGWREATGARNYNGFVNLGRRGASRGISLQLYGARSRAATAGSLPESIFSVAPRTNFTSGDFEDLDAQQLAIAAYAPTLRGSGSFTAYVRRSGAERFNVNQPPDDDVRSRTTNATGGANADWRWASSRGRSAFAVRAGIDAAAHRVRVRIYTEPQGGGASGSVTTDVRSPSWDVAGYTIGDVRFGRVALSGGARYDYVRVPFRNLVDASDDTTSTFHRLNPRAGVSVDLGGGATAYASIGQSFRAPAILELGCADPDASCPLPFALGDDPPLKPVLATTSELGARWAHGVALLAASLYRTEVRDEIFFVASETALLSGFFTNIARTRRQGAELSTQLSARGGRVSGYASYAWTLATFQSPAEIFSIRSDADFTASPLAGPNDVEAGDRLPLTPEHQVKAGTIVRLPRSVELGVDARYVGAQWMRGDEANETRPLPGYALANARIGVERREWEVTLVVQNVLQSRRSSFGTFNENRKTGELERFLTPLSARALKVVVQRAFGGRGSGGAGER
jgi:outer membrane receptor protein involved in Fe transport